MKRVLMINFEFPPIGGGTATANFNTLTAMEPFDDIFIDMVASKVDRGNEISDFTSNSRLHRIGIRKENLHHWKANEMAEWLIRAFFYSRSLISKNKYDYCFCWTGWPSGMLGYAFKRRVPYLIALRGHDVPGYEVRFKTLEKLFLKRFSRVIWKNAADVTVNSEMLGEMAKKTWSEVPLDVIYNGVDVSKFSPPIEKKSPEEKLTLISTGRLGERKGYKYLIEAIRGLENVELKIVGNGAEKAELQNQAKDLPIEFLGYKSHTELPQILRSADVYISTSFVEGMSNSTLEAMASGLPVIITNVGGSKELLNGNGTLIEKTKDSESIRKAILGYIKKPSIISEQSTRSRSIAESLSWDNTAKKYYELMFGK